MAEICTRMMWEHQNSMVHLVRNKLLLIRNMDLPMKYDLDISI